MLITTLGAFAYQLHGALTRISDTGTADLKDLAVAVLVAVLMILAIIVFWEGAKTLANGLRKSPAPSLKIKVSS